ncbi:MAG: thioredoxin family protein [Clostridium sp.]
MEKINRLDVIRDVVNEDGLVLTYYLGSKCGACDAIKIKIEMVLKDFSKVKFYKINAIENPEIAAAFNVFALPVLILYGDGKEITRVGRYFNELEFKRILLRMYEAIY